ncbi:claudin-5 [Gracilinanus agilis]|uniref:claudin-5 n=1 Tax=Gracilinanus agilis TaxID=191870 RepID=UPI001CFF04C7|nr:claudin-5 [Gracilinanus agilis]
MSPMSCTQYRVLQRDPESVLITTSSALHVNAYFRRAGSGPSCLHFVMSVGIPGKCFAKACEDFPVEWADKSKLFQLAMKVAEAWSSMEDAKVTHCVRPEPSPVVLTFVRPLDVDGCGTESETDDFGHVCCPLTPTCYFTLPRHSAWHRVLALKAEVQAGRALTVLVALLGLAALLVSVAGAQCTTCVAPGKAKARVAAAGGSLYVLCGLLALVPLCWYVNIVISDFHSPAVPTSQKREMGSALYIGWAAAALLLLGGGLLCCGACSAAARDDLPFPVKYSAPRRPTATGDYDKKNYV